MGRVHGGAAGDHLQPDVLNDQQASANGYITDIEVPRVGKIRGIGPLIQLSETPASIQGPPPEIGEHNEALLRELGYDDEQVKAINEHTEEAMRIALEEAGREPPR